jgi:hypothetical protein
MIAGAFEWILKGKPTAAGGIAARGTLGVEDPGPDKYMSESNSRPGRLQKSYLMSLSLCG